MTKEGKFTFQAMLSLPSRRWIFKSLLCTYQQPSLWLPPPPPSTPGAYRGMAQDLLDI